MLINNTAWILQQTKEKQTGGVRIRSSKSSKAIIIKIANLQFQTMQKKLFNESTSLLLIYNCIKSNNTVGFFLMLFAPSSLFIPLLFSYFPFLHTPPLLFSHAKIAYCFYKKRFPHIAMCLKVRGGVSAVFFILFLYIRSWLHAIATHNVFKRLNKFHLKLTLFRAKSSSTLTCTFQRIC